MTEEPKSSRGRASGQEVEPAMSVLRPARETILRTAAFRVTLFLFYFAVAALLEWHTGAFQAELGGSSDEPAHYITGLMVHDYVAGGFPPHPFAWASNYYVHYPKVALGQWPPVFYIVQAAWTLLFTPSRISVMLLMAAIAALLATLMTESLREDVSNTVAICAGAFFLTLPVVEEFTHLLMSELLVALFLLVAILAFGRYLDKGHWRHAAWFGVWSALAILTKGTGLVLAFVPPVAILLTRRWRLLGSITFWIPAAVVLAFTVPWYLFVPGALHQSVAPMGGLSVQTPRISSTPLEWFRMLSVLPTIAALVGAAGIFWQTRRFNAAGKWAASLGVILGAFACRLFIGAFEIRHLLICLPEFVMFAAVGVSRSLQILTLRVPLHVAAARKRLDAAAKLALAFVLLILISVNIRSSPIKPHYGFSELAQFLLARPDLKNSVFLVCANSEGEGAFISEVASREARPGHFVLRATKMLADSDWMGWNYKLRFTDQESVLRYLETIPAGIVILDETGRKSPHGQLLYAGIQSHPEKWELLSRYESTDRTHSPAGEIVAYRLIGHEGRLPGKIEVNLNLYGTFTN